MTDQLIQACEWFPVNYLIFSENVFANYIYYSHIIPAAIALMFGLFVFFQNKRSGQNISLLFITGSFAIWSFFDLILWATNLPEHTMFFWSILIFFDLTIYVSTLYLVQFTVHKKAFNFSQNLLVFIAFIPLILFAHTKYNLIGFDLTNCDREALEGILWHYVYLIEILLVIWMIYIPTRAYGKMKSAHKKTSLLTTVGATLLLTAFSFGNIFGSLEVSWDISQFGLFGMPVFIAFLSYLIVRYQAFNSKAFAAQFLTASLFFLTSGILFIRDIDSVRNVVAITIVLILILGYLLVKSVKKEIEAREEIQEREKQLEKLNIDLKKANDGQSKLLHFIAHQVKGYFTKSKFIFDELRNDSKSQFVPESSALVKQGFDFTTEGVDLVQNVLNASNIERGTIKYTNEDVDLKSVIADVINHKKAQLEEKGLELKTHIEEGDFTVETDPLQVKEVFKNLLDNSIRYTLSGSIDVSLIHNDGMILFKISDTGVGITKEDMSKLFTKGGKGSDSSKVNAESTGYGLYIVKGIVESALKGRIWVESDGKDKGSTFFVQIPQK